MNPNRRFPRWKYSALEDTVFQKEDRAADWFAQNTAARPAARRARRRAFRLAKQRRRYQLANLLNRIVDMQQYVDDGGRNGPLTAEEIAFCVEWGVCVAAKLGTHRDRDADAKLVEMLRNKAPCSGNTDEGLVEITGG